MGQDRVASELSLKLGICVSPRTERAYWSSEPDRRCRRTSSQHWQVFVYLYQVHLYPWLETNDYGRFLADNDL